MIKPTIAMDFDALDDLQNTMQDNLYLEYVFHKLFDNPTWTWEQARQHQPVWHFPECWRARYWLYYSQHQQYLQGARILDLGSNMNFYGTWALLHGAAAVTGIEPDKTRYDLGCEYAALRGVSDHLVTHNISIDTYRAQCSEHYDVVFLLDVLYYLVNGIDVLTWIRDTVKPRYVFLESTVVEDFAAQGHFEVWYPETDTKKLQSFGNTSHNLALKPSRQALFNVINNQGWKILSYYDYQDFRGHGESPPRRQGLKDFYLLERTI